MSKKGKRESNSSSNTTTTNNNSSHVGIAADSQRHKKIKVSTKLANFLGSTELETRNGINAGIWDYIKTKGLRNPKNKWQKVLDDKMKKVFRCDSFTTFNMNKYIEAHIRPSVDSTTAHSEYISTKSKKRDQNTDSKRTIRMATAITPDTAMDSSQGAFGSVVGESLSNILNDPMCKDEPSGPFKATNDLLARITKFGIIPYKFQVPLGDGFIDCVGHDRNNRLCVVYAMDMSKYNTNLKFSGRLFGWVTSWFSSWVSSWVSSRVSSRFWWCKVLRK